MQSGATGGNRNPLPGRDGPSSGGGVPPPLPVPSNETGATTYKKGPAEQPACICEPDTPCICGYDQMMAALLDSSEEVPRGRKGARSGLLSEEGPRSFLSEEETRRPPRAEILGEIYGGGREGAGGEGVFFGFSL